TWYSLSIDYNLFDKIWISSLMARSNNSRNEKELSSFTPENTDPIPATNTKTYKNSWKYKLNCNFFITDNLFNKLYYNLSQSQRDDYVDPLSSYMSRNSKSSDHALCYQLIWLTYDKPVKLQKILSEYNNYYGHLLPQNEFKWLFEITYSQSNGKYKWMYNPTYYNKNKIISRYFAIRQAIDYGITNSANLSFGGLMEHKSNPGRSSNYENLSRMQMQIGFTFYNYSYTENTMNWMTLSDFDYRHGGALLKKGMMKFNLELDSPTYEYGWPSNKLSWFNFKWSELKNIYYDFSVHADFSAGVYHNIELTSSISSPIFPKQYPLNAFFNNYIKWQPLKNQRIILYFPFNWEIVKKTTGKVGRVQNNSFTLSWVFLF
ncbi:hypothetical protein JW964_09510, partial [candidate division KSB1 bacterium]|nr:hypothetical protein [candidate division KSB1 bacterium]